MTGKVGTIYLLHFQEPFHHAKHYMGWTSKPEVRFDRHLAGGGSKLVHAVVEAGIGFQIAWMKPGTRDDERALKNKKCGPRLCPICERERKSLRAA